MNLVIGGLLLCCAVAGRAKTRIANRGEVASEGEFPYHVSIKIGRQHHHCGGSLISTRHVLTAAHCVHSFVQMRRVPQPMTVEVGSTWIGGGTIYGIKRMSYYRGYMGEHPQMYIAPNDIAMIHLAKPVEASYKVATINLPRPNTPVAPGTEVILSGFGKSDSQGPTSQVLKKMVARITPKEVCKQYYLTYFKRYVTDDKICAAREYGYGACQGDSGGPLVDKTKSTVLGVVSAGDGKCSNGQPDTYTDVSQFISYIYEELNYHPSNPGSASQNPAIELDGSTNTDPYQIPGGYPLQNPNPQQFPNYQNSQPQQHFYPPNHYQQQSLLPGPPSQNFQNPFRPGFGKK